MLLAARTLPPAGRRSGGPCAPLDAVPLAAEPLGSVGLRRVRPSPTAARPVAVLTGSLILVALLAGLASGLLVLSVLLVLVLVGLLLPVLLVVSTLLVLVLLVVLALLPLPALFVLLLLAVLLPVLWHRAEPPVPLLCLGLVVAGVAAGGVLLVPALLAVPAALLLSSLAATPALAPLLASVLTLVAALVVLLVSMLLVPPVPVLAHTATVRRLRP